jgi:hypothetical protein
MAELQTLDLRLDPCRLDAPRHPAQHIGGRQKSAVAEVERAAIEGADLGPERLEMGDALGRARYVGAGPARRRIGGIEEKIAAHPSGKIDDIVGAR